MLLISRCRVFVLSAAALYAAFSLISCSSTKAIDKNNKKVTRSATIRQQLLPDGWDDSTNASTIPAIRKLLVHRGNSAAIIIQEFHTDDSTHKMLADEDICVVARISMQLKVGERSSERRVTRVPERMNGDGKMCSYVYEEKGLLRRVIVLTNTNGFFECEALQMRSSLDFDSLTKDQMSVVKMALKNKIFNSSIEPKR